MMVSKLGAMPEWSVLAAPASRKVQSILENRAFRGQARHGTDFIRQKKSKNRQVCGCRTLLNSYPFYTYRVLAFRGEKPEPRPARLDKPTMSFVPHCLAFLSWSY